MFVGGSRLGAFLAYRNVKVRAAVLSFVSVSHVCTTLLCVCVKYNNWYYSGLWLWYDLCSVSRLGEDNSQRQLLRRIVFVCLFVCICVRVRVVVVVVYNIICSKGVL